MKRHANKKIRAIYFNPTTIWWGFLYTIFGIKRQIFYNQMKRFFIKHSTKEGAKGK